jgi:glycerol-3-phosphate dehydrogenase
MFRIGFEFSDCRVDDARLVVLNSVDAAAHGAVIRTRTRAVAAARRDGMWDLTVEDTAGRPEVVAARVLVNAAGPWVEHALALLPGAETAGPPRPQVRLVQGSHIVVPQLFTHDRAYMFQNPDGRIVFAIPFEGAYTLIGTTDRDFSVDPAQVAATADEISYLCEAASEYFARPLSPADVVWSFAGVRPLHDEHVRDAKAATRDYVLELDATVGSAPILSIIGGKITTYRRLAEAALEKLAPFLPRRGQPWTGDAPLPGGDFAVDSAAALAAELAAKYPFLSAPHASRLVAAYGTRAKHILAGAQSMADLGLWFGATLTETEVRYLMTEEFARTAEDVLWRRTKLGLVLSDAEAATLDRFMAVAATAPPVAAP